MNELVPTPKAISTLVPASGPLNLILPTVKACTLLVLGDSLGFTPCGDLDCSSHYHLIILELLVDGCHVLSSLLDFTLYRSAIATQAVEKLHVSMLRPHL